MVLWLSLHMMNCYDLREQNRNLPRFWRRTLGAAVYVEPFECFSALLCNRHCRLDSPLRLNGAAAVGGSVFKPPYFTSS